MERKNIEVYYKINLPHCKKGNSLKFIKNNKIIEGLFIKNY